MQRIYARNCNPTIAFLKTDQNGAKQSCRVGYLALLLCVLLKRSKLYLFDARNMPEIEIAQWLFQGRPKRRKKLLPNWPSGCRAILPQ